LGTEEGKLIALHADGSLAWTHELTQGPFGSPTLSIVASPAVGADGSIYVIGRLKVRGHTDRGTVLRYTSELHKFRPGGGLLWHTRLPPGELNRGGNASAPPNIWQASGTDVVMVSAAYSLDVTRLFARSTDGVILVLRIIQRIH
jgi:outer membrane protein assembly factor BamB